MTLAAVCVDPQDAGYDIASPWARLSGFSRAARHARGTDELLGLALAFCTDLFPGTQAAVVGLDGDQAVIRARRPGVSASIEDAEAWVAMARSAFDEESAVLMDRLAAPASAGLALPLWAGHRLHGALCIASDQPLIPDPERLAALEMIADRVAFSLRREAVIEPAVSAEANVRAERTLADLAELRRAHAQLQAHEAQLREGAELLRLVLEHLPVGVWIAGPDGSPVQSNPACRRLWGGDPRGAWVDSGVLITPEESAVDRAITHGESTLKEVVRVAGTDGRPRVVLESAVPIRDPNGVVRGAVVVNEDVTERHRAEADLRFLLNAGTRLGASLDLGQTLRAVAEVAVPHLGDVALVDVKEGERYRRSAVAHGHPIDSALREQLSALALPQASGSPIVRAVKERTPSWGEVSSECLDALVQADSEAVALRDLGVQAYLAVPLVVRDEVVGILTLLATSPDRRFDARDVFTARELGRRAGVAIDNARLHAATCRAVAVRDELLNVASHDLKTPVSALYLRAQLLERKLEGHAPPQVLEGIRGILSTANQMERLIADVLESGRAHGGRLVLCLGEEDVVKLAREALEVIEPLAQFNGLKVESALPPGPIRLMCDRGRIQQVLSNLLGNALKFTPRGGRIRLGLQASGTEVTFTVKDTGRGIPSEDLPHVFEARRRAHNADGVPGFGLGLSIVRNIIEAHRGEVSAESKVGKGTTIRVSVPRG